MNAATHIALSSIKSNSKSRNQLLPGRYEIDKIIHVTGTLTVGEDYSTTPTVSLPVKEVLALFVVNCGMNRDEAIELLRSSVADAIALKGKAKGEIAGSIDAVSETLGQVQKELLAKLPSQPRKGKVSSKLAVAVIDMAVPVAA